MEQENRPVIKKDYKTFKEAFAALPEELKKHSIRVAEYTRAMFIEAIAIEMRVGGTETEKLQPEFERCAYLCGLYHDIGKVLVPEQYHNPTDSFSEEEMALYRKHIVDGGRMVDELAFGENLSDLERRMIKNALTLHHLKPKGEGFPQFAKEDDIMMMALIVGFANYLDHLVTTRRSETPFEDVMQQAIEEAPEEGSELLLLMEEAQAKLQRVFIKYQEQSMKIPTVAPFAKRKQNRPFELKYRAVTDRKQKATVGLQAKPYFKDGKDIFVEYEEVKTVLNKNKLHAEVGRYFLYEAADTLRRINACELPIDYIAVELMPKYYTEAKIVSTMQQLHADSRLEPGRLYFSLEESMFENPSKALMANLERISSAGIPMFLNSWSGEYLKAKELTEYSFKKVALHPSLYKKLGDEELVSAIKALQAAGVEIIAGELDKTKYNGALNGLEITAMTGALAGDYIVEDEMILGELALHR